MASTSSEPYPKLEAGGGGEGSEAAVALMVSSDQSLVCRGLKKARKERACTAKERISKMPPCAAGKRSSIYRGVTRHRWTGRYEAHLWDKSTWNQNQNKKGKQVYLGAYDDEEAAARAYDLAALKYWGAGTHINFPVSDYTRDLEEMLNVSREEYLASLRRKSSVFSRGISRYRGLSSPWEPLFGRLGGTELFGNIHYGNEAAIEGEHFSGFCIERKFDLTSYIKWWGSSKFCRPDSISRLPEETKHNSGEDIGDEYKEIELAAQYTEPYQMPRLGPALGGRGHKRSSVSALSILSRSAAFKNLQERVSIKKQYKEDEYHQKTNIMASFLSAPLLTDYNTTDPMADPTLWPALIPVLSPGISRINEVTKTEE